MDVTGRVSADPLRQGLRQLFAVSEQPRREPVAQRPTPCLLLRIANALHRAQRFAGLTPHEVRRALFEERGEALCAVFRAGEQVVQVALKLQTVGERQF